MYRAYHKTIQKLWSYNRIFIRKYINLLRNPEYEIHAVPALEDNYMYLLVNSATRKALAVDPVEPDKIFSALNSEKAELNAVLTTHHHLDHCGGNEYIHEKLPHVCIYGGDERISSLTNKIVDGEDIQINSFAVKCLFTPCHTSGHMCYFIQTRNNPPICFSGDTLFVSGCGRFFEGTAEHMLNSLNKLAELPPETLICCGHEYTISNLKYSFHVQPNNTKVKKKLAWALERRKQGLPTVPSTIGEELEHNPFMRVNDPAVQSFTKRTAPVEIMAELRKQKDLFKPIN